MSHVGNYSSHSIAATPWPREIPRRRYRKFNETLESRGSTGRVRNEEQRVDASVPAATIHRDFATASRIDISELAPGRRRRVHKDGVPVLVTGILREIQPRILRTQRVQRALAQPTASATLPLTCGRKFTARFRLRGSTARGRLVCVLAE